MQIDDETGLFISFSFGSHGNFLHSELYGDHTGRPSIHILNNIIMDGVPGRGEREAVQFDRVANMDVVFD